MTSSRLRRSFTIMHLTLGLVILVDSLRTAVLAWPGHPHANVHLVVLASVEAVGALLFLMPALTRLGGGVLLTTFGVAFLAHAISGEFPTPLLVYAATTLFVMVHGPVSPWSSWRLSHS
jgi:uncharacterized membrane protein YphA (DoxX/SURF4 family)